MTEERMLTIDELPDMKSILDYTETRKDLAIISHPGWKTHRTAQDMIPEEGLSRAQRWGNLFLADQEWFLDGRHVFLEIELLQHLSEHQIPTLLTVPVSSPQPNLDNEHIAFKLDDEMSVDLVNYLRSFASDNFYFIPTSNGSGSRSYITGDFRYCRLDKKIPRALLEITNGKKVIYAGSNLGQCANQTLGYLRFSDCEVRVLLNYCGLPLNTANDLGRENPSFSGNSLLELVNNVRQEQRIRDHIGAIFDANIPIIEGRVQDSPYNPSPNSKIIKFEGYVSDLKL